PCSSSGSRTRRHGKSDLPVAARSASTSSGWAMKTETLDALIAARAAGRAVALITDLAEGSQRLVDRDSAADEGTLARPLEEAFARDRSGTVTLGEREYFIHVFNPPLRMIVIGAVHVAQALIPMARAAEYAVTVIDPRAAFATAERFPDVSLVTDWPDEALSRIGLDARSALLALTHDPKIDDPALGFALRSPAFYIGALGSKRTHSTRLERLKAA